jgi:uncharacterized protein YbjT (DUF2867 family)
MKIILIGANGKIGELVQKALAGTGYEIVKAGRKSGDFKSCRFRHMAIRAIAAKCAGYGRSQPLLVRRGK